MNIETRESHQTGEQRYAPNYRDSNENNFSIIQNEKQINYLDCDFERYVVKIALDEIGRFVGIKEIKLNKNFYDPAKLPSSDWKNAEAILDELFEINFEE